jgi:hypothetical protein
MRWDHAAIMRMVNDLKIFKHPEMICPGGILANPSHLFVKEKRWILAGKLA